MDSRVRFRCDARVHTIHDDEPDTSAATVGALLAAQCPGWAGRPLRPLRASGTSNAMWRLGDDLVVRLPRTPDAAAGITVECALLPALAGRLPVGVPQVAYAGRPGPAYPFGWAVLSWQAGRDAWAARHTGWAQQPEAGRQLADVVRALRAIDPAELPALSAREPGERGGPVAALADVVRDWAHQGADDGVLDAGQVLDAWDALAAGTDPPTSWVVSHGDLIPGNLLLGGTGLTAVIDWGGAGIADPALDLLAAWTVLGPAARAELRTQLAPDPREWRRSLAFALQQAVAGVAYYVPRGEAAGRFHARTLATVLQAVPTEVVRTDDP